MAVLPLVLPASSTVGRDGQVAAARLINGYPEFGGEDAKSPFAIYGAPGLTRWDSGAFTGAERGMIELSAGELITVLGNQIVSFDQSGNGTTLANLVGSGRVFMARNQATPPQIGIVTSAGQYYVLQAGVLTLNADPDLPAPSSIDYLRGRFLYSTQDRVYASDTDDGANINALAFGEINSNADNMVRVLVNAGFLYAFGTKSLEIWQPDPSLAGQPFPFSPVQQDIEYGLTGPHTVAKFNKALIWVDQDFIVRHGRDGGAERVSTHAVERSIGALTNTQRAAMVGSTHVFEGHETYTLKGANFTWCLDLPFAKKAGFERAWYERKSYGLDHWRVNSSILFAGKYILGDESNGRLYSLEPDDYTENGNDHVLEIWCPHSHRFPERLIADGIEVDIVSGVGVANTVDASTAQPGLDDTFSKVLLHFSGIDASTAFTDESAKAWTAAGNAQIDTAEKKFGASSGLFDGTGDYISTPDSADFALGSGDWTADCWFNCVGLTTTGGNICGQGDAAITAAGTSFFLGRAGAGDTLQVQISDGSAITTLLGTTQFTNLLNTGWHHAATVRTGNVLKLFVDGVQEGGDVAFTGSVPNLAMAFTVGARSDAGGSVWNGWIDEFRLSVGIARWTSAFTPPVREYGIAALAPVSVDPEIMIDFSANGGKTFVGERRAVIGRQGEFQQTVRINRWGQCTQKGRTWRIRASAAVLKAVNSASLWARATG